jgi:hypothetical protein
MPGAPNRPPEKELEAPVEPPLPVSPAQRALRRLAPSRVALLLDLWKGAPSPELMTPFEKAEAAYAAGDFVNAVSALDLLSVRFAEPRWPTIPEPFRQLRVPIPAPMPPHWNPEHILSPTAKEAARARRTADEQLALAAGTVAWASAHHVDAADLGRQVDEAREILGREGLSLGFYERIDAVWEGVLARFPRPTTPGRSAPPAAAPTSETEEA